MNASFKQAVENRVKDKPHLTPVFTSTHEIPERLYQYDHHLFVVFNNKNGRFEIHSLEQQDTYCATLPYKALDARAERYVRKNNLKVHGEEIFKRIERSEEAAERRKKRDQKNWVESIAKETRSEFAKSAWL